MLGGGRRTKEDVIDLRVGLVLEKKVGDEVREGDVIAVLHAADEKSAGEAMGRYLAAVTIGAEKPEERKLIHGIIE